MEQKDEIKKNVAETPQNDEKIKTNDTVDALKGAKGKVSLAVDSLTVEVKPIVKKTDDVKSKQSKNPSMMSLARDAILNLLAGKKVTVTQLTDAAWCKANLKIRYEFLRMWTGDKACRFDNGYSRFSAKVQKIEGKEYVICNDLFARHVEIVKNLENELKK